MRDLKLAAIDILIVWVTILWMMVVVWKHNRWVAIAQVPYFVWVTIATVLQLSITLMVLPKSLFSKKLMAHLTQQSTVNI